MAKRQIERQRALQFLFGLEFGDRTFEVVEAEARQTQGAKWRKGWSPFAKSLAQKTFEKRAELDGEISKRLEHWKIERLPLTDRICLRMALCEFREFPDIPLRVTMDEYIELARMFGTEDSPKFVNGVLDALGREFQHKDVGKKEKASETA